jgi:predicted permease
MRWKLWRAILNRQPLPAQAGSIRNDLDEELRFHLEQQIAQNIAAGMSPEAARYAALRAFGGVEQIKEECRDARGGRFLEELVQDVRYGLRILARSPGFTAVAVLTLALGIGVNTAIFSLLNDTILARLPIQRPQELVQLTWVHHDVGWNFNWPDFQPLLEPHPALPGLFAYLSREATLQFGNVSERARVQQVSGSYYSTLGLQGFVGRTLSVADDLPGAAPAAVLSYAYWRRRFALDPSVLGRTVYLENTPLTIVGVTPPQFYGLDRLSPPDITCPLHAVPLPEGVSYYVYLFARLKPPVSLEEARARVTARFHALLEGDLKRERSWIGDWKLDVVSAGTGEYGGRWGLETPLGVLGILVGIVLLICCTNLASLLLGRTTARSREIAVRLAVGAGRWRIIRQLLTESVLLGMGGGCLGLAVGSWVHHLLITLLGLSRSEVLQFRLHIPLLGFTAGVSVLSGIVFGLVPALRSTRLGLQTAMRGGAPAATRLRLGPTRAFLIVQVAASVVLLVGATLFVRTLRNLEAVDAGFNRNHLLLMTIDPRESRFQGDRVTGLLDELMERVPALPGVRSAALASSPLFGVSWVKNVWVQGNAGKGCSTVAYNFVGPGFFATAGIPLLMGREFSLRDRAGAPLVAVANESFARNCFPGQNPLGQRFGDMGPKSAGKYEIIGVVEDARHMSLRLAPVPAIFQSLWQFSQPPFVLHARVVGDPGRAMASVRRSVQGVDPGLVVYGVRTMTEQINGTMREERTFAMLCALFGALVLSLCCIGLYGVASYSVTRRTNEIGVRMALGAGRADVLWLFVRETLALFALGVTIGTPVALASTGLIKSLLFELKPSDPSSVFIAILTLAGVAAVAALLPAHRATKVDPIVALRYE